MMIDATSVSFIVTSKAPKFYWTTTGNPGFEMSMKNTSARRHRFLLAQIIGTIGYVDPTYEKTGFVTHKSDIFSLGVVLFEVLCGRRAFIPDNHDLASPQLTKELSYKEEKSDKIAATNPNHLSQRQASSIVALSTKIRTSPFNSNIVAPWSLLANGSAQMPQPSLISNSKQQTKMRPSLSLVSEGKPLLAVDRELPNVQTPAFKNIGRLSSFNNASVLKQSSSFSERRTLYTGIIRQSSFVEGQPSSFINVQPSSFGYGQRLSFTNKESSLPTSVQIKSSSSKNQRFILNPLFTMKGLKKYTHSPNEELLSQSAKSHYEEGTLYDVIHPDLRIRMDPQSFDIFAATAYCCLKQRSQRPNIDQIAINLEKALNLQRRYENPVSLSSPSPSS